MSDDDKHSSQRTPTPVSGHHSPSTHLKRKERPDEDGKDNAPDDTSATSGNTSSGTSKAHPDEYEAGFITCETCGTEVSFRDDNNGFTTKLWDAHRMTCSSSRPPPNSAGPGPVMFAVDSAVDALGHPPAKRRRAKRTEEERIEYLRSDPYVGQFEAYRVLCASCDKWIRLRPNSTYCSIPWDAHRKSCLAKKINNKNVYALEERNSLFSKDPDVRKFDPERLLCNICDKWLSLPPDDHLQAVQKWLQHRATCQRNATASSSISRGPQVVQTAESQRSPGLSDHPSSPKRTIASPTQNSNASPQTDNGPHHHRYPSFNDNNSNTGPVPSAHPPASPVPFHALTPSNYGPAHESRRRNAEQRAANLREDPYIAEVEPNRVFCKLCQKWVQLRQDSSYCAYPWMQHRQKCEARHFRRTQKAAEIAEMRARKQPIPSHPVNHAEEVELVSDREASANFAGPAGPRPSGPLAAHPSPRRRRASVRGSEDIESEDGVESLTEDGGHQRMKSASTRMDSHHPHHHHIQHHQHQHQHQQRHFIPAAVSASTASSSSRHPYSSSQQAGQFNHGGHHNHTNHHHQHHQQQQPPVYYPHTSHHYKSRSAPMPYGPSTSTSHNNGNHNNNKYLGGNMSQAMSPTTSSRQERGYPPHPPHSHSHSHPHGRPHSHSVSHPPRRGEGSFHHAPPRPVVVNRQTSLGDADDEDDDEDNGDEMDAEGEADMDTDPRDPERKMYEDKNGSLTTTILGASSRTARAVVPRRPLPVGLADLDSPAGRKQFIFSSVEYLFSCTYESTDDMSISALLAYLNAAMPPDKHEDFDTTEVVRAVASLKDKGKVVFEGDILRLVD